MIEVDASRWSCSVSSCTRRLARLASADFTFSWASWSSCSSAGLLSSSTTVFAATSEPGCTMIRSTRPLVAAGIQRRSSGTSVPEPRTCRIIGPRCTVSIQSVARSTPGAAGFSRETPTTIRTTMTTAVAPYPIWRVRLRFRLSGRAMSISGIRTQGLIRWPTALEDAHFTSYSWTPPGDPEQRAIPTGSNRT